MALELTEYIKKEFAKYGFSEPSADIHSFINRIGQQHARCLVRLFVKLEKKSPQLVDVLNELLDNKKLVDELNSFTPDLIMVFEYSDDAWELRTESKLGSILLILIYSLYPPIGDEIILVIPAPDWISTIRQFVSKYGRFSDTLEIMVNHSRKIFDSAPAITAITCTNDDLVGVELERLSAYSFNFTLWYPNSPIMYQASQQCVKKLEPYKRIKITKANKLQWKYAVVNPWTHASYIRDFNFSN